VQLATMTNMLETVTAHENMATVFSDARKI